MLGAGNEQEEMTSPLFSKGVTFAPMLTPPPFREVLEVGEAALEESELIYSGVASSDGSMIDVRPVGARRAGWSAVAGNDAGELRFVFYGTCPDRCPTAHRAELWGVLGILRRAVFPLTLITDCEAAINAWKRGRAYCCDGSRKAADLWRSIWDLIDEKSLDGQSFKMVWAKGHTTLVDVLQGRISALKHALNVLADRYAGRGSEWAKALSPNDKQLEAYAPAVGFYTLLAKLCGQWPGDYEQTRAKPIRSERQSKGDEWSLHRESPHELWKLLNGRVQCARCMDTSLAITPVALKHFAARRCRVGASVATGLRASARRHMLEANRKDLQEKGAILTKGHLAQARPAKAKDLAIRSSTFMTMEVRDLRAPTSRPFRFCRVAINVQTGCLSTLGGGGGGGQLF